MGEQGFDECGATLSFKIDVSTNINEAYTAFRNLNKREIPRACKRSIGRALVTLRKEAIPILQKEVRLKSSVLKDYMNIIKPTGSRLDGLSGSLVFSSKPISMIHFVKGSKTPENQKGKKVSRRRKLKYEYKPGRSEIIRHGFIANGKSGNTHVFKRKGVGSLPIMKQSAPSLGALIMKKTKNTLASTFTQRGQELFTHYLQAELKFRASKEFDKVKRGKYL